MLPTPISTIEKILYALQQKLKGEPYQLPTPHNTTEKLLNLIVDEYSPGGGGGGGSDYELPIASDTNLGGIKVGSGLSIEPDGTLSTSGGGSTNPFQTVDWYRFKTLENYSPIYAPSGTMTQVTLDEAMLEFANNGYEHFYVITLDSSYLYFLCIKGSRITLSGGIIIFSGTGMSYETGYTVYPGRNRPSPINWSAYNVVIRAEFHVEDYL